MEWIEKIVWHEVVTRPPTEEEIEEWVEQGLSKDEYPVYIFSCALPDDGCDILVLTTDGFVYQDNCMIDSQCGGYNSFYLDNRGDWDDVVAWAYVPTGKKDEEAANAS